MRHAFTAADLPRSVVAVPPLARNADLSLNRDENVKLIRHLEDGGVRTLLYGGNANFYNIAVSEYADVLDLLEASVGNDTAVIPSVGPDYGKMMDQAKVLRGRGFATAMVLPASAAFTAAGVATGVRRFVEAAGVPAVLYIKADGFIDVDHVRRLVDDGLISVIKYAVVRDDPADDAYLHRLVDAVDRSMVMSGIGEQPALVHLRDFGLGGFTSGCVCVAPRLSMDMLAACGRSDWADANRIRQIFKPLEDLRNRINPIRVLHEAVELAGIADTGPVLPLLSNLDPADAPAVEQAARTLLEHNARQHV